MIRIIRKAKDGITLKYPNGKTLFHTWDNFNQYFEVGEKNEAVLKESDHLNQANSLLEEAIQIATESLTSNDSSSKKKLNQKIDEIMVLTNTPEEKRKVVQYLIWREAKPRANSKGTTTLGDLLSSEMLEKLNKGN